LPDKDLLPKTEEKMDVNAVAAQKSAPRVEDVDSKEGKSNKELLFEDFS
jgi:hypothetical protein